MLVASVILCAPLPPPVIWSFSVFLRERLLRLSSRVTKILEIFVSRALLSRYLNPKDFGSFRKSHALGGHSRGNKILQAFDGGSSAVLAE